jgi:alkanesulfonate monooxygenase SsuD/methylene tetrahydromethanopterin reductase-like flavin-dependent oxidoreductase (luciferase family)
MELGYQLPWQNMHEGMDDEEFYGRELDLAELAEPLGFDAIACTEHHFDGEYSQCPDSMQLLSYLAGRTETIKLTTAGVILPWWDQPLRVAEKLVLLDTLSKGRLVVGVGRGLARSEYSQFGIDMNESRERFDESIDIILRALETGVASGNGKFYVQPEARLRPAPTRGFRDRLICIAMSEDSLTVAANLGAAMATFIQFPIERHVPAIEQYRERFRALHGTEAPPVTLTEFVYCHEDPDEAERVAREYITKYYGSVMRHYEFLAGHFATTTGYESYHVVAEMIREAGNDTVLDEYVMAQTWGTPEQILEKIEARRGVLGPYHLNSGFSYSGMPYQTAAASMKLFAQAVIPEAKRLWATPASAVN